jgi:hypothetical protein
MTDAVLSVQESPGRADDNQERQPAGQEPADLKPAVRVDGHGATAWPVPLQASQGLYVVCVL